MSYRVTSFALVMALHTAARADLGPAAPPARAPADWLADADIAGPSSTYAVVPLPPATAGSVACVLLVAGLRFTRHRRWVTLR